jgi:hypothetical protein
MAKLAAFVAVMAGVPIGGRAYAAGDANRPNCPAMTESSPGFRASLPDCRAYEVVSEANSDDTSNVVGSYGFPEGERVYYKSFLPTPDAGAGNGLPERFLATRTASGWMQQPISPPQGEGPSHLSLAAQTNVEGVVFAKDFSEAFVNSFFRNPFESPVLNQTTGMGVYKLSLATGAISMLSLPDSGVLTQKTLEGSGAYAGFAETNDWGSFLVGGSADGSRAFFVTTAKLATAEGTPQDTHEASNEIYERTEGHTYLVGVLPDGTVPVCGVEVDQGVGSTVGTQAFYSHGAVAPSGANVVFKTLGRNPLGAKQSCNEEEGLFLRDVVDGRTVKLPGSIFAGRAGTRPGEEEKIFMFGAGGLEEYHIGSGETTKVGQEATALLTYTQNGSHVFYLGSNEEIVAFEEGGAPATEIPGTNKGGYKLGNGAARGGGNIPGVPAEYETTANMPVTTSDGSRLLFIDVAELTGYKTETQYEVNGEIQNERHHEAYVYDAAKNKVTCISCNPDNINPVSHEPEPERRGQAQLIDLFSMDGGELPYQNPSPPFISNDGSRAVFETNEALVPQDVNGTDDVYEWEREGAEGCSAESGAYSSVDEGCIYMLSSGLGKEVPNPNNIIDGTHLVGASENLQDVYIQTSESLLPGLDKASKLYDVRIDGGFPFTQSSRGCEQCASSGVKPAPLGASVTEVFGGAGNVKSGVGRRGKKSSAATRRRKLERALRSCRTHQSGRKRRECERRARRRFGARPSHAAHVGGSR